MTLRELRNELTQQIRLVKQDAENIPQAESIANLAGKTLKTIQQEIQAEIMRENGSKIRVLADILEK
jgi:hypothetical protein